MKSGLNIIQWDGIAGLVSGLAVWACAPWVLRFHNWSLEFINTHVVVSIAYGLYALSLGSRLNRPLALVNLLAAANCLWALICGFLAIYWQSQLTVIGQSHLFLEMLFVGSLGLYEWKHRHRLSG